MARKNKDIQILVKLASQGNFDEAQKQLDRLKQAQGGTGAAGASAFGKMQGAMTAWSKSATLSAANVRRAFMTVLGPIGAILTIVEVFTKTIGKLITWVQDYKKEQAEANKTIHDAAAALGNATGHLEKYAQAAGLEQLQKAIKAHEADLQALGKNYEQITAKVTEAKASWYSVAWISSETTRTYQEQLALLSKIQGETQRALAAKQEQLDAERKLAEETKKREAAETAVSDRIAALTLNETELKIRQLGQQLAAYKQAGVDKARLEELYTAEIARIQKEADDKAAAEKKKKTDAERQVADRIAQLTLDETEVRRREVEAQLEMYRQAGVDRVMIEELASAEAARIAKDETARKAAETKKREAADEKEAREKEKIEAERAEAGRQFLTDLASFSESKTKEMAAIGKTAASAQALIDTYVSANAAYKSLAGIPIYGPVLAPIAAAAAMAAGMARVAAINAVPALEQGGVTLGEQTIRVGEKRKKEGILPLEDPRAMRMVGKAISDAGGGGGGGTSIVNNFHGFGWNPEEFARRVTTIVLQQVRDRTPAGRQLARAITVRAQQDPRGTF